MLSVTFSVAVALLLLRLGSGRCNLRRGSGVRGFRMGRRRRMLLLLLLSRLLLSRLLLCGLLLM